MADYATKEYVEHRVSAAGLKGDKGERGAPGAGVTSGGTAGQIYAKASAVDYDGAWTDPPFPLVSFGIDENGHLILTYPESLGSVSFGVNESGHLIVTI